MSKLEYLLQGVEVEWLPLEQVCNIFNGFAFDSKKFNNEGIGLPLIRIRDVNTGLSNTFYSGEYSDKFIVNNDDILIGMDGDFMAIKWIHNKALLNQRVCRLQDFKSNILSQYIYYIVQGELDRIHGKIEGSTVKHLSSRELGKSLIPIPPLEIQQEIVRVLDELTSLTNQLTTELETERQNRKKQFEYFREQLFKEINLIKLGDNSVGEFIRGSGLQKKDFTETGVGCIHYGQLYTHYKTFAFETKTLVSEEFAKKARKASTGDLIIATTSENDDDVCKAVAWLGNEDIAVSSDACFYRHKFNPKYVAYYFQTEQFQKQKRKYITGTKVRRVNANDLAKILIPNPSLEEQERIVKLLDQFDATHSTIKEEITKEIKLRTQQYDYYREKLLSFSQN
ncbi:type I restriction enzyme, S subunit [Chishuiella changwenlii]|uniref:Type I restriction enzyme, S subunit n=1 Tax=Chishuiella changwenlii TaxID=1434701 RepID=A0A1M6UX32_9FLAO|nr:restriction endonuclease subunit S [Chishuiella changwenlii]GGF11508.1 hypothetical protein GCM10010984_30660 [Chishuiella changwenlii]SHK73596.1 type I restriction enzyme, S subunit [Chishuiella changwenlii]